MPREIDFGARIATQEYCPPATGYAEHNSANEYATQSEQRQTPSHDQTMTGGPPLVMPTVRTPPSAVQHVTMLKEKPIMPMRENERLSSTMRIRQPSVS